MVSYIRSDLDFILAQIKIAEAHAAGQPLYGPGGLIPTYNLAWGLRTVDGTYNNLLHPTWGSSDQPSRKAWARISGPPTARRSIWTAPARLQRSRRRRTTIHRTIPTSVVVDPALRTISNLIVDQTLGNPSAILTALQRAGIVPPAIR